MDNNDSLNFMSASLKHPLNAELPICRSDVGKAMLSNFEHPENAFSPNISIPSCRVISIRDEHPVKHLEFIDVIYWLLLKSILSSIEHPEKAPDSMLFTDAGI